MTAAGTWSVRTALRQSVGRTAIPAVVLLIAVHVVARPMDWTREWFWATWAFHFVTIFLAPLAAGLGAWEGTRLGQADAVLAASGGAGRAVLAAWAALVAWLGAAYVVGLAVVLGGVHLAGHVPGWPDPAELSTIVPALALVAASAAVGLGAGARARSLLAAPLAAVAVFALLLVGYLSVTMLVRVGGATASLVGLRPRPLVQLLQLALFASVGVGGLTWARLALGDGTLSRRWPQVALGAGAAVVLAALITPGIEFLQREPALQCRGATPQICVAEGYRDLAPRVAAAVAPYVSGLRHAGIRPPQRFVQGGHDEPLGVGSISHDLLVDGVLETVPYMVIDAWTPRGCDLLATPERQVAWSGLVHWMHTLGGLGSDLADDPELPPVLIGDDPDAAAAWVRDAIDELSRCAPG